jgi:purine nucleosidase
MQPIVIDTDMGVDDALAIMLALNSPEVELMGLTTVAGNVPLEQGTRNALQVLELQGRDDIPVYMGAVTPLERMPVDAQIVHGLQGLGEAELAEPQMLPAGRAVDYLIDEIMTRPGEVVIIALGPLTNLALAEQKSPGILNCARRVIAMGGALWCGGNVTETSEFNSFADPHALRALVQADVNLTLVPLDVTQKLQLLESDLVVALSDRKDKIAKFISDSTRSVIAYEKEHAGFSGLYLHDPAVVALIVEPKLFETKTIWIDVDTSEEKAGQVLLHDEEAEGAYPVEFAIDVDVDRFMIAFKRRVLDAITD